MASAKNRFNWVSVVDVESAAKAMHTGGWSAAFNCAVTSLVAMSALIQRHPVLGLDGFALLDAAIFGMIAWRIYRLSFAWSVGGLLFFLMERVEMARSHPTQHGGGVITIILFLGYLSAVRGGWYLRTHKQIVPDATLVSS
jgi:hypothetical protein